MVSWTEATAYDSLGRVEKRKQSRNNQETKGTYFADGSVKTEENLTASPAETTTYTHDVMGRTTAILADYTTPTYQGVTSGSYFRKCFRGLRTK